MTIHNGEAPFPKHLDLRNTKCPLNFVKARLAAEKLAPHDLLELWLDASGESALNIPNSLKQEGYTVDVMPNYHGDESTLVLHVQKTVSSSGA